MRAGTAEDDDRHLVLGQDRRKADMFETCNSQKRITIIFIQAEPDFGRL
jgi:hypothetical protein